MTIRLTSGRSRPRSHSRNTGADAIPAGTVPGFAEAGGGKFMSVQGMPDRTVQNMATFMDRLRGMHKQDSLAFEVCVRHVAPMIEDQRRREGHTDPRDDRAP